jgi:hypothetical protein
MSRQGTVGIIVALFVSALMLSSQEASSCSGGSEECARFSLTKARILGWITLHRPDGEVVHIKADQIVFVMSAPPGAHQLARSRVQVLNGFADVRETVDEVMAAIQNDDTPV